MQIDGLALKNICDINPDEPCYVDLFYQSRIDVRDDVPTGSFYRGFSKFLKTI